MAELINPKLQEAARLLEAQPSRDGLCWLAGRNVKTAWFVLSKVERYDLGTRALAEQPRKPFTFGLIPLETVYSLPDGDMWLMRGRDFIGRIEDVEVMAHA